MKVTGLNHQPESKYFMRRELALRDIFKKSTGIHSNSSHSLFQRESFSFLSCKALVSENIPFISSWPQCPRMANWLCARWSNSSVVCVSSYELTNVCSNFFPCLISSLLLHYCHKHSNELWDSLLNLLPDQPQILNWTCNILPWKGKGFLFKNHDTSQGKCMSFSPFQPLLKKYRTWNSSSLESL